MNFFNSITKKIFINSITQKNFRTLSFQSLNLLLFLFATFLAIQGFSSDSSPVGKWKTIDDHTGNPRSIVKIIQVGNEVEGIVEKTFPKPGEPADPKCLKCEGERKDQPVIGMKFMWGLKREGEKYTGGEILDPDNGKIYKCKLQLNENGDELTVRGYIGISLLGRSQVWKREADENPVPPTPPTPPTPSAP